MSKKITIYTIIIITIFHSILFSSNKIDEFQKLEQRCLIEPGKNYTIDKFQELLTNIRNNPQGESIIPLVNANQNVSYLGLVFDFMRDDTSITHGTNIDGSKYHSSMPHGIVVDKNGNFWVSFYYTIGENFETANGTTSFYRPLRCISPSGEIIHEITIFDLPNGGKDTLWADSQHNGTGRGINLDNNGYILYSSHSTLYRFHPTTGECTGRFISPELSPLTDACQGSDGTYYVGHVINEHPCWMLDKDFNLIGKAIENIPTIQRCIQVLDNPEGGYDLFIGPIYSHSQGLERYHSDNPQSLSFTIQDTLLLWSYTDIYGTDIIEAPWASSIDITPNNELLIGTLGTSSTAGPYKGYWYILNPYENPKFENCEQFGTFVEGDLFDKNSPYIPEGSNSPRGAFITDDNIIYTVDFNLNTLEKWIYNPDNSKNISVISPNGGEIFTIGSRYNVSWKVENISNINISYTIDEGATWHPIVNNIESSGNYTWIVPDIAENLCKIRVSDVDDSSVFDESDRTFSIVEKTQSFSFTQIPADIEPLRSGSCEWGDFDNDGLMDFLITGRRDTDNLYFTGIYKNLGNDNFGFHIGELPGVAYGKTSWGDFDNDGDLDILLSGYNGTFNDDIIKIYRNDEGKFISQPFAFDERLNKAIWGDIDNDGDLDIFANSGSVGLYFIYRNEGNQEFTPIEVDILKKLRGGDLQFVDYNNDGNLDLFITGRVDDTILSLFYTNNGNGEFTAFDPGVINVWDHAHPATFGDLDSDGDQDMVIGGSMNINDAPITKTKIYSNDGGAFSEIAFNLPNFSAFSSTLGDLDNDGDLDLICGGYNASSDLVKIFQNDGDFKFVEIQNDFVNAADGCYDLADYDNDGDLDILVMGTDGSEGYFSVIYRNDINNPNDTPRKPLETLANVADNNVVLNWTKVLDSESKRDAICYNVYVGTETLGNQLVSSHSNNETGIRLVTSIGNAGQNNRKELNNLPAGKYFWAVQSIDNNFQGSAFSDEKTFTIEDPAFIEITTPNGGEEYEIGDEMLIQWNSKDITKVRISFTSNDGGDWSLIAANTENTGEFAWRVPQILSNKCKIRILDAAVVTGPDIIADISDDVFTIKDTFLPEVAVENHNNILPLNGEKEILVHAADAAGIRKVEIFYRKGGDEEYQNSLMATEDTQNFHFTFTSSMLTRLGLEYYVVATDSSGNINETELYFISIYCNDGIQGLADFHSGNQGSDYRFFSIPLIREDNSAEAFLNQNTDIGKYDPKKIRLYGFRGSSQQWIEYPDLQDLKLGAGYAMLTNIPNLRLQSGKGNTVPISENAYIPLVSGWNIIGNPFNHNIPIEKIEFTGGFFELWNYQGNWQEVAFIKPWMGYAVYVENDGDLILHSSHNPNLGKESISTTNFNWQSTIQLTEDSQIWGEYKFGQHPQAKPSLDEFDRHSPPQLPDQVSLGFLADGQHLSKDFHPANDEFDQWKFQIKKTGNQEKVRLNFSDLPQVGADWDIFLIDQDIRVAYNLLSGNNLDIRLRNNEMNFLLIMGQKELLKETLPDISFYPEKFVLYGNFPNPFNPTTQINYALPENSNVLIEIYNLKGEKVQTLVNERKSFGNYSVVWNAEKYSSGVYLIKMQTEKYIRIRKCMLVK